MGSENSSGASLVLSAVKTVLGLVLCRGYGNWLIPPFPCAPLQRGDMVCMGGDYRLKKGPASEKAPWVLNLQPTF